jgi:Gene Transfer Agent (GTA)-like protein
VSTFAYPSFQPANQLGYAIGTFPEFVPPWLADTIMLRPYGEYGMATYGIYTKINGGYWVNANNAPNSTDLPYIVKNDLKIVPNVKKVIIALHWYTSNDTGSVGSGVIVPAIGPEVQAWNWLNPPNAEWLVTPWTRANAYYLKPNHQVWPTPDDAELLNGIRFLQSQGYEVGISPIATLMSFNYYYSGGGECQIDRSLLKWTNAAQFTTYLANYQTFYEHYINLLAGASLRPWIFYIGYGMRDITGSGNTTFVQQFVNTLYTIAGYAKQKLPNTLVTYAADLDEYFYPFEEGSNVCYLDPLWTCPDIDLVGINWFAPLAVDDTEDNKALEQGVLQGEGDTYIYSKFQWRGSQLDRFASTTTRNFKTGLTKSSISPLTSGIKEIIDWLSFWHYYPAVNGVLGGCTPLPNMFPGDPRLCSQIHGYGPVGSVTTYNPTVGGLAPIPGLNDTWAQVQLHSYMFLTLPQTIPDNSVLNFDFIFEIDPSLTDLTGNYRLFNTTFGLSLDSIDGTITLWIPTIAGSFQKVPLFSASKGEVALVYSQSSVQILVDGAYDLTITPRGTTFFVLPSPLDSLWMGNPAEGVNPAGYGVWQGNIYFLSIIMGAPGKQSGGQFFFDDTYAGIRTAWTPNLKPWMVTAFGYGSVQGSAADPQTPPATIISTAASRLPNWYEDYTNVSAAKFVNGSKVWDIQGPYGSTFDIDDVYQALVMNAASLGLLSAGAQYLVAWFFDTREKQAYLATNQVGFQIFNDAYDYEINCALNGKAAIQYGGTNLIYTPETTPDEDLGLSIVPGPLPFQKVILVQSNVPQV